MAIKMVRVPSETPNISNIDDFAGLRYAYGNQNGYVISKGQECSYTINGSNFKINSGRLVLQGVECDIDANGVNVIIDNVSTTRYYSIYLQVNLALNETKILAQYDTATYPNIDIGNDLTQNTTGTARMELYHFKATSGVISNIEQIVSKIEYSGTALSDYDNSKGTIEERLDALGFKQGSLIFPDIFPIVKSVKLNKLERQGNYVLGTLNCQFDLPLVQSSLAFTIPDNFKLNMPLNICCVQSNTTSTPSYMLITNTFVVDGIMDYNKFYLEEWGNIKEGVDYIFQFGYRANPLTI